MSIQGASTLSPEISSSNVLTNPTARSDDIPYNLPDNAYIQKVGAQLNSNIQRRDSIGMGTGSSLDVLVNDGLHSQDSFGRWINDFITDSSDSVDGSVLETSISSAHPQDSLYSSTMHLQSSVPEQIFNITDVSPAWAYSNEKTKVFLSCIFHYDFAVFIISDSFRRLNVKTMLPTPIYPHLWWYKYFKKYFIMKWVLYWIGKCLV